jgi:hypothetical protein
VYNSSTSGASFGTSLFISKSSTQWDQSVGYGKYSSAGLFSNHDQTGQCGAASCTAAEQASLACPAAPLGFPTPSSAALAAGVPASVAGGQGCPAYTQTTATTYANYKLVWTPDWLAWMVNSVVMRNETLDVRPGFVPWYVSAHACRSSHPRELSFSVSYSQAPGHASPAAAHQLRVFACADRSLCSRHAMCWSHRVCARWLDSKHGERRRNRQPRAAQRQHRASQFDGVLQHR